MHISTMPCGTADESAHIGAFDITEFAHHAPEDIFISTVTIIGALIIMFTIQWKLALVIAVTIPIFLLVVWKCRFSMQNASRNVKRDGIYQYRF